MEIISLLNNTVLHLADRYINLLFYRLFLDYTVGAIALIGFFSMMFYGLRLMFSSK